jgi:hypothetical protein
MGYLDTAGKFEGEIKRGVLSSRSKRLDALVSAVNLYVQQPDGGKLEDVEKKLEEWKRQDPKEFADRGSKTETQLRYEIAHQGVQYWGKGSPRIMDAASHPRYQPGLWNDGSVIQFSTNCYAYACNDPRNHKALEKPQPGDFGKAPVQAMTDSSVRYAVMRDDVMRNAMQLQRLVPLVRLRNDPVPAHVTNVPGYYLIALVTAPNADYHWLRQDADGMWSHKPGWDRATNRDSDGALIFDPREAALRVPVGIDRLANQYIYADYHFTTFYFAPKGGVRTGDLGTQRLHQRRASF